MSIQVGDELPDVTTFIVTADGPAARTTGELFAGKTAVLFALTGAFTPTCDARHLPGFIDRYDALTARGVDVIYCLSVNDPFVMKAWGDARQAEGKVVMIGDGDGAFTRAVGLSLDLNGRGFGLRSRRYAMIVEDGVVRSLDIDEGGLEHSAADAVLARL